VYLKRLELLGFKSFPEKTVIKLTNGVTSVVGPNGCGKSNILDAMRWVLGEQKVSLLRGSKMEEIIFNGTRDMKPLGMAEVTLVILNSKGRLPTEYSEVQITRRLFRSGDSEYLLNKVPCRLKDITDLLMDTGVGAHVYSMIQQDMVDAILSDRTDDRRFLFEEAAGISKYKNRKKAALRKLESTEQDLVRLQDIVSEVTTQTNSLKRQVRKAERFQELSGEHEKWEIYISKQNVTALSKEKTTLISERDELQDEKTGFDTKVDSLSAEQEQERKHLTDLDRELSDISNRIYEKSEAAHNIEKEISVLGEKKDNARILKSKNSEEIDALGKRHTNLLGQIEEVRTELDSATAELNAFEEKVESARTESERADEILLEARRKRESLRNQVASVETRLSAGKTDDTNIREQEEETREHLSEVSDQQELLHDRRKTLLTRKSSFEEELREVDDKIQVLRRNQTEIEAEIKGHNEKIEEITDLIFDLNASLEAAVARRKLLSEMIAHYEGFGSGTIATLNNKDRWPELVGAVADHIAPNDGFEVAIEAALGESAGYMICRNRTTANDIIRFLRDEKKGRAGFLILDEAREIAEISRPSITGNGFLAWADQCVRVDDDLSPLARLLLGPVAIIKPGFNDEILPQLPSYFSAVTTDGELIHSRAVISGGSSDEISLLGRKEKIEEQEHAIRQLRSDLETRKNEKSKLISLLGQKQAGIESIQGDLNSYIEDREEIDKKITSSDYEIQAIDKELERLENESYKLNQKLETLQTRQYDLNLNYDRLVNSKDELEQELSGFDERIESLDKEAEDAERKLNQLQISRVEKKSVQQQLESKINHINELIADIERTSSSKSDEITDAEVEARRSSERILLLEKELKDTFEARSVLSEKQTALRESRDEIQQSLDVREKDIKQSRSAREELNSRLHTIEIRTTEIDSEIRNISSRISEEFDVNIHEVEATIPDQSIPEAERRERMQQIREQLKNMGGVNLLALEEYKTASERQEFLSAQLDDLMEAKATLQSTINKINSTARKLFLETFESVRENFKKVFEELFTGGESDIRLTNPDDPLESPIEIIARPRGKKLLSIAQMSGGERALTAISLLFAIYLAKPSPFCILDEIDAPLDDTNITRFLRLIKAFSDQTQFIIITHNKLTMEAADVLYGVTMEKPGVSKVVSVRFNEDEDGKVIDTIMESDKEPPDDTPVPEKVSERMNPNINQMETVSDNSSEE